MSQKENGGPAFPPALAIAPAGDVYPGETGMMLRDWFAGQAVGVLIGATAIKPWDPDLYATMAYRVADAMLAERAK